MPGSGSPVAGGARRTPGCRRAPSTRTAAAGATLDIKPANLLFDEHGIVPVADFGLAEHALAEASWTEPAGTVLGTTRYASPEQGTTGRLDGSRRPVRVGTRAGRVGHGLTPRPGG